MLDERSILCCLLDAKTFEAVELGDGIRDTRVLSLRCGSRSTIGLE
jgi:hypothetical protein